MSKIVKCIIAIICLICHFSLNVYADNLNNYRSNSNWIETSKDYIDSKYATGDKFIVAYVRSDCGNCKYVGTNVLTEWMNSYSYTIYGVDVDSEGINNWARNVAGGGTVTLPLVAFVNKTEVVAFQGASEENIKLMNDTFIGFNKETPTDYVTPSIKVKSDSVYKHSIVTVVAEGTDVPEGYCLAIYDAEGNLVKKGNQYFAKYSFPNEISKSTFLNVVVVNDGGMTYKDTEGNEISQRIEITIKNGFFDNIVAFFKWLFKSNEITIAP